MQFQRPKKFHPKFQQLYYLVEQEQEVAGDSRGDIKVEVHATAVHHDQVLEPKVAHAMSHEISHSQAVRQHPLNNIHTSKLT